MGMIGVMAASFKFDTKWYLITLACSLTKKYCGIKNFMHRTRHFHSHRLSSTSICPKTSTSRHSYIQLVGCNFITSFFINIFQIIGVSPSNQAIRKYPFDERVLSVFLSIASYVILQCVYMFHGANSFMAQVECICSLFGAIMIFACFAAIEFRETTLFQSIGNIERLVDTSKTTSNFWNKLVYFPRFTFILGSKYRKSKALFAKTTCQVERLSAIVFLVLVKITVPLVVLPKFIISFVVYFLTNSRSDSFALPYPMW